MLLKWRLRGFKSFKEKNELLLGPLTVFCGANSSGKSSVLQSMLLIKQTLQHGASTRPIALNGPLVRLGSFTDIENSEAKRTEKRHSISIGWEICPQPQSFSNESRQVIGNVEIRRLAVDFEFDTTGPKSDRETLEIQPNLSTVNVNASYADSDEVLHNYSICVGQPLRKSRKTSHPRSSTENPFETREYVVRHIDPETKARSLEGFPKGKIVGPALRYFMPTTLHVRFDKARLNAQTVAAAISTGRAFRRDAALEIPDSVVEVLQSGFRRINPSSLPVGIIDIQFVQRIGSSLTVGEYTKAVSSLPPSLRRRFLTVVDENKRQIDRLLLKHFGIELSISQSRVDILRESWQFNDSFFRFLLQYVGPLRDEPRPLYALQALTSPTDVGPKGELTAAVLHLNEKRQIDFIAASAFLEDEIKESVSRASLKEALLDWMRYLGIAHDFDTSEKGKFGHELRIKTDAAMEFQDLTNVGVGISQVLPVLVACLLSPPGATIILEQPELHLHPAVQARLGDFFIAMGLMGKQCIIETHGEHIIDRFRFRIASDENDKLRELMKIYFFKQKAGNTSITNVEVTKFGAITEWPDDFFDQSQKEAQKIVTKALARRKAERQSFKRDDII